MHRCILFVDEHHHLLASINDEISGAISQACSEIIDGKWHENSIKKAIFATDSYFGEFWSMTITPLKR